MSEEMTIDTSRFNANMAKFSDMLGIEAERVVRRETGELMKTLVKVTPPQDPDKTRSRVEKTIESKFDAASDQSSVYFRHKLGGDGDITWYHWDSKFLYGVAREKDMREASPDDIYKTALSLTKGGRQQLSFGHPRKSQKVLLSQSILATKFQIDRVVARIKRHVGRLKAGWLVGWDVVNPSGGNMPPKFVMDNRIGARGRYVDGLGVKEYPQFSIANSAMGVNDRRVMPLIQFALDLRAKAMATNFRLFFKGKKELSDY